MNELRQFLDEFVLASMAAFEADPTSELKAKNAVHWVNVMAERYWHEFQQIEPARVYHAPSPSAFRRELVQRECSDFQLVWDIDDASKHVCIGRAGRHVTNHNQSAAGDFTWGLAPYGDWGWFSNDPQVVVALDDGTQRSVLTLVHRSVEMWVRLTLAP